MTDRDKFVSARDFLLAHRGDYERAYLGFRWPSLLDFNWAPDFFDTLAQDNHRIALELADEHGELCSFSFLELRERSNRVANFFARIGIARGDRVLVMLPNVVALWEVMLAAMKVGAVISPTSMLASHGDLEDRIKRGQMRHVLSDENGMAKLDDIAESCTRVVVGNPAPGWIAYADAYSESNQLHAAVRTSPQDPLLLYFTSGTTARPKMVLHTFQSYPVGHLSTMYWLGVQPGDRHWNISSPGWAKHAWSSFFAPWSAEATVYATNQPRFDAKGVLDALVRDGITSICAPPTVWRSLVLHPLEDYPVRLRNAVAAGEPLNPEIIVKVQAAWGITIRDGYGQTETTCIIGNSPGQPLKMGSMGRPMPGYRVSLLAEGGADEESGEIAVDTTAGRPPALMIGYVADDGTTLAEIQGRFYATSDVAMRDADGYYWYVGRNDDVFKSSDYRISPFELESLLLEHELVAEAAVVASPDPLRLFVPKACIALRPNVVPTLEVARSVLLFVAERAPAYKRIRRIEFCELPKTISGKIRRGELRQREAQRSPNLRFPNEFWEEELR